MKQDTFDAAIKNASGTTKKIADNPNFVKNFTAAQLPDVLEAISNYNPQTPETMRSRRQALKATQRYIDGNEPSLQSDEFDSFAAGRNIASNSCVFQVKFGGCTFTNKISSEKALAVLDSERQSEVEAGTFRLFQDLINKKHLKPIWKPGNTFQRWIKEMSLPGYGFTLGGGQNLIPVTLIPAVRERIQEMISDRNEAIDRFVEHYESYIEEAKVSNGKLFEAEKYPTAEEVRNSFVFEYKFIGNQVPEELKKVSEDLYEAEKERIELECAAAAPQIREALRQSFLGLVDHFANALKNDEKTGRRKVFSGSNVTHLVDFISLFNDKDLTGDKSLKDLVSQAKSMVDGFDIDKMKSDDEFRAELEEKFTDLADAADSLIGIETRQIELD